MNNLIFGETDVLIKNYIFDFGNVLARFQPDELTAHHVSDIRLKKYVSEVAFDRVYWDKLDIGSISDEEVKSEIRKRVSGEIGDLACTVYDNWVRNLEPVENMEQLIYDIKKTGKGLYLLSNISIGFASSYRNVRWIKELFDCFDGLVFSGVVKMVKPDERIYRHLLEKFGLKAEECLFVDDSEINIAGAETMGIKGYLFDGDAKKLREYLGL